MLPTLAKNNSNFFQFLFSSGKLTLMNYLSNVGIGIEKRKVGSLLKKEKLNQFPYILGMFTLLSNT